MRRAGLPLQRVLTGSALPEDGDRSLVFGRNVGEFPVRADLDRRGAERAALGPIGDRLEELQLARGRVAAEAGDLAGSGGRRVDALPVRRDCQLVTALEVVQLALAVDDFLDEREPAVGAVFEDAHGVVAPESPRTHVNEPTVAADGHSHGTRQPVDVAFLVLDDLADAGPPRGRVSIGGNERAGAIGGDEYRLAVRMECHTAHAGVAAVLALVHAGQDELAVHEAERDHRPLVLRISTEIIGDDDTLRIRREGHADREPHSYVVLTVARDIQPAEHPLGAIPQIQDDRLRLERGGDGEITVGLTPARWCRPGSRSR